MSKFWPPPDETNGSCNRPGIYRFTIAGEGIYVGRYTSANRPLREYGKNVEKLIEGRPYRPSDRDGFRYVHVALHRAVVGGCEIRLEIVENVERKNLNERERFWIAQIPEGERLNGRRRPR
jgi:hypothetical protein